MAICHMCDDCYGYYRTKRRDPNSLISYYCENSKILELEGAKKEIGFGRNGVYGIIKTAPRWCPKNIAE